MNKQDRKDILVFSYMALTSYRVNCAFIVDLFIFSNGYYTPKMNK